MNDTHQIKKKIDEVGKTVPRKKGKTRSKECRRVLFKTREDRRIEESVDQGDNKTGLSNQKKHGHG